MNPYIEHFTGTKNNPSVLIITGVHGNEYSSIVLGIRVMEKLKQFDKSKYGKISIISGVNPNALKNNSRDMVSESNMNLNRMLTDSNYDCVKNLKQLIFENDVIIDIHATPNCASLCVVDLNNRTTSILEYLKSKNIKAAVRNSIGNTIKQYCFETGKIGFTYEVNENDDYDLTSLEDIMRMLCEPVFMLEEKEIPFESKLINITSNHEGIFMWNQEIPLGEHLKKGKHIFDIMSLNGDKTAYFTPVDGFVIDYPNNRYINKEDIVCEFQPVY